MESTQLSYPGVFSIPNLNYFSIRFYQFVVIVNVQRELVLVVQDSIAGMREEDRKFKASLGYRVSVRSA